MQPKYIFPIAALAAIILFNACGEPGEEPVPTPTPGVVVLLTPSDNTPCLKNTTGSGNTASINFTWTAATDAASYQLDIVNLNTQITTTYKTTYLSYRTNLEVGMPYSWKVVAINTSGNTSSSVWKFYLAGIASSSYTPYPADLTSPFAGSVINSNGTASVTVTFQWTAGDPDNDIATYTLFLDNTDASTQVLTSLTSVSTTHTLESGKTYYWKICTTDKVGNSSVSAVSSFQIK